MFMIFCAGMRGRAKDRRDKDADMGVGCGSIALSDVFRGDCGIFWYRDGLCLYLDLICCRIRRNGLLCLALSETSPKIAVATVRVFGDALRNGAGNPVGAADSDYWQGASGSGIGSGICDCIGLPGAGRKAWTDASFEAGKGGRIWIAKSGDDSSAFWGTNKQRKRHRGGSDEAVFAR